VLRFADHPGVTPIVVRRLDERSTGPGGGKPADLPVQQATKIERARTKANSVHLGWFTATTGT
jgi:hypothetical protein